MKRSVMVLALLVVLCSTASRAQTQQAAGAPTTVEAKVPTAAQALAAWQDFRADPLARLDRTQPFLDFIRDSGQVHIVLNNNLLAWMYQPMDDALKATLYAAFLGGNMAAQLDTKTPSDNADVAGMTAALDAYAQVRKAHPDFKLPLFEHLSSARAKQGLAAAVKTIETDAASSP